MMNSTARKSCTIGVSFRVEQPEMVQDVCLLPLCL
jgi:hypothetical protein